ncbi:hypothetical protein [Mesorhizobium sp. B2-6-2]|uniref:hypothetical protein n=1 Tax=Mesorhizobium sp. B2-6-2 TaxID=2589915 RepID=UPI00112CBCD4|nr:hypothetical protein [Mesorhizobium sp. B2-6-2]TPJ80941.1 hypothetical protein FJ419_05715 [Mesorhizobium sp. B2-6-2]
MAQTPREVNPALAYLPSHGTQPALYALIKLHAEIGWKLQANQAQREKLIEDMKHVEAVLHLLEPGFNAQAISIKRRNNPNPLFKPGHVIRGALDVLRTATAPMSAEEIALVPRALKGLSGTTSTACMAQ